MITYYHRSIKEKRMQELETFKAGSWIFVEDPTEQELEFLAKNFHLEQSALQDALDIYEVPRLEKIKRGIYMYTRFPYGEGSDVATMPILLIVTEKCIITIAKNTYGMFQPLIKNRSKLFTTQTNKTLLQMLQVINQRYDSYLTKMTRLIRSFEVRLEKIKNQDIVRFVLFEGIINDFRPSLVRTNSILESLMTGRYLIFYEADKDLIEDIMLSNKQLIELAADSTRTLINIREAYTTIITNNLNRVIKLLTSLTVILTIPTMIASLYGMNVRLPIADHPYAFLIIMVIVLSLTTFTMYIFLKKDYF